MAVFNLGNAISGDLQKDHYVISCFLTCLFATHFRPWRMPALSITMINSRLIAYVGTCSGFARVHLSGSSDISCKLLIMSYCEFCRCWHKLHLVLLPCGSLLTHWMQWSYIKSEESDEVLQSSFLEKMLAWHRKYIHQSLFLFCVNLDTRQNGCRHTFLSLFIFFRRKYNHFIKSQIFCCFCSFEFCWSFFQIVEIYFYFLHLNVLFDPFPYL